MTPEATGGPEDPRVQGTKPTTRVIANCISWRTAVRCWAVPVPRPLVVQHVGHPESRGRMEEHARETGATYEQFLARLTHQDVAYQGITDEANPTASMMSDDRTVQIRVKRWWSPSSTFTNPTSR